MPTIAWIQIPQLPLVLADQMGFHPAAVSWQGRILAVSERAQQVALGSPVDQALSLLPAQLLWEMEDPSPLWSPLLEDLLPLTPVIEPLDPGEVVLDLTGVIQPLPFLKETGQRWAKKGLAPHIGVGERRLAAWALVKRSTRPGLYLQRELTSTLLSPLPLGALPLDDGEKRSLGRLGLTTLGELAALPLRLLQEHLGERGILLHQLAQGVRDIPTQPLYPPPRKEASRVFTEPLSNPASILPLLCRELEGGGARLGIWVQGEERVSTERHFAKPLHVEELLPMAQSLLASLCWQGLAQGIGLILSELASSHTQLDLFSPIPRPDWRQELDSLCQNMRVRYGPTSLIWGRERLPSRRERLRAASPIYAFPDAMS